MTHDDNSNAALPPIQLLIAACQATNHVGARYAWLNGFCLLTIQPRQDSVELTGEVRIGHRFAENANLVRCLADALDPGAVLAGRDLDYTISRLGRLPIDADQPAHSLALLGKLAEMLEGHPPIDVGCDEDARNLVHNHAAEHSLEIDWGDDWNEDDDDAADWEEIIRSERVLEPGPLSRELADTAGACLLAIGDCWLGDELKPHLLATWESWRRNHVPVLPPVPTLVAS